MKCFSIDALPSGFSTGKYHAVVVECHGEEFVSGIVTICMNLILIHDATKEKFSFKDTIVNHTGNPRSKDFFEFLTASNIQFEDYEELEGLVFSAELIHEQIGDAVVPILTKRELV